MICGQRTGRLPGRAEQVADVDLAYHQAALEVASRVVGFGQHPKDRVGTAKGIQSLDGVADICVQMAEVEVGCRQRLPRAAVGLASEQAVELFVELLCPAEQLRSQAVQARGLEDLLLAYSVG